MTFMGTCLCDTYVHSQTICANAISLNYPINTESNVVHCVNNEELAAAIPAPLEPNLHVREKTLYIYKLCVIYIYIYKLYVIYIYTTFNLTINTTQKLNQPYTNKQTMAKKRN